MGFLRGDIDRQHLKADIRMIAGCEDSQTSADVSNVHTLCLPDPCGKAGGACTSTLLHVVYKDGKLPKENYSFVDVLYKMRDQLLKHGYTQIPQLSTSKPIDSMSTKFELVPESATGERRALLIGINYVGHEVGELTGCHNDVGNMIKYITKVHGFQERNMTVLMDDGQHEMPTYDNIIKSFRHLAAISKPGDALYIHFSGHGGFVEDDNGDEDDGFDETLIPVDYAVKGMIRDDDLFDVFVRPLCEDVHVFCLMDCCHSGSGTKKTRSF